MQLWPSVTLENVHPNVLELYVKLDEAKAGKSWEEPCI